MTGQKQQTFEDILEKLDGLVKKMEAGNLPLEEMLKDYEAGTALLDKLQKQLETAEKRLAQVRIENGKPIEEPAEYQP